MKKIILIITLMIININVYAIEVRYIDSNYYMCISDNVKNLKKVVDVNTNTVYFDITAADFEFYPTTFNFRDDYKTFYVSDEVNKKFIDTISSLYIPHKNDDNYYFHTQILLYKYHYGENRVSYCTSDGTKITGYDLVLKNLKNNVKGIIADEYNNEVFEIDINDDLVLSDKYYYWTDDENVVINKNKISFKNNDEYTINYILLGSNIYYSGTNSRGILLSTESKQTSPTYTFKVNVTGEKIVITEIKDKVNNEIIDEEIIINDELIDTNEEEIINNPKTIDKIYCYVLLLIISSLVFIFQKKLKKS